MDPIRTPDTSIRAHQRASRRVRGMRLAVGATALGVLLVGTAAAASDLGTSEAGRDTSSDRRDADVIGRMAHANSLKAREDYNERLDVEWSKLVAKTELISIHRKEKAAAEAKQAAEEAAAEKEAARKAAAERAKRQELEAAEADRAAKIAKAQKAAAARRAEEADQDPEAAEATPSDADRLIAAAAEARASAGSTAAPAPAPAASAPIGEPWASLAHCESTGNWAINTGNGYYGGLQFSLSTWRAFGGQGMPHENSPQAQIEVAKRVQASQGWGAWPACTRKLGLR